MSLELFAGSYNIDAQTPPDVESLAKYWLQAHLFPAEAQTTGTPSQVRPIDIYIVGLQEVKHFEDGEDPLIFQLINQELWSNALLAAANWRADGASDENPFVLLERVDYSSVTLVVLARKSLTEPGSKLCISSRSSLTHKLHDAGMTGKKGVAGVEMIVSNQETQSKTTLAVMTSHFQAYSEKLDERLWDADQVCTALQWPSGLRTTDFNTTILVGDLNYRIVLPNDEVKSRIASDDLVPLLKADELFLNSNGCVSSIEGTLSNSEKPVFSGWRESPIGFKPTYKYVNGTDRWDDSGKQRTPAWCDRVLTHGRSTTTFYSSAVELKISDHRPILALITVPLN